VWLFAVYIHTRIHTYIHTYIHAYIQLLYGWGAAGVVVRCKRDDWDDSESSFGFLSIPVVWIPTEFPKNKGDVCMYYIYVCIGQRIHAYIRTRRLFLNTWFYCNFYLPIVADTT
jgi:hypothetical protein